MSDSFYFATADEMALLDKLAVESGLEIRQMMELAGWHIIPMFRNIGISYESEVVVVCGKGNKGGDGLSAARHLANHGWGVSVVLLSSDIKNDPQHYLNLLEKMKLPIFDLSKDRKKCKEVLEEADVIIDALIGYNLKGAPYGVFREAIDLINKSGKKVIAYDLPSGIDATTGECFEPCINADATLTLALPKLLFQKKEARKRSGAIYLGDIGIPTFLYKKIKPGLHSPFRNQHGLIKL